LRRGCGDPQLSGRVSGDAVEHHHKGAGQCGRRPQGAGKGPLRPGKGEGADSGDHRRPADESGRQGADPLPGGPARRGQDLHCHQRGQGAEPEAGPPEPGRRSGRGGHP
ncbi:Thiosulfate sulfurtransferase PspE, partial [Dysosmobacter welbionis]